MTNPSTTLKLQGKRFGRLLVIRREAVPGAKNAMWLCQCDCGTAVVSAAANIGRTTFSCGCLAKETAAELLRGNTTNRTHNKTGTDEYRTWQLMKRRCYNKNDEKYPHYGGRGITVCDKWINDFPAFLADMGPRPSKKHSIDRERVNGNYDPDNCSWAVAITQMRNTTRNVFVTIDGATKCVSEWIEHFGITNSQVYDRVGVKKGYVKPFKTTTAAIRHFYKHRSWP